MSELVLPEGTTTRTDFLITSGMPKAAFIDLARRYTSRCFDARLTVDVGEEVLLVLLLVMLSFPSEVEADTETESRSFSASVFARSLAALPMIFA